MRFGTLVRVATVAVAIVSPVFLGAAPAAATLWATTFGVAGAADAVATLGPAGAATLLPPAGHDLEGTGLAFDTSTGTLYVSNVFVPGSIDAYSLGVVDLSNGSISLVGAGGFLASLSIPALAYAAVDDVLYGYSTNPPGLMTIDRGTGVATLVGAPAPPVAILGLAYDPNSDTLYGASATDLYTVDTSTGALSLIGPHGMPEAGFEIDLGLELDREQGALYAVDESGQLFGLDRATGAAVAIGSLPQPASGLAAIPAIPVPAAGAVARLALVCLLGSAGVWWLRRAA
jgi:hypothetical protein